MKKEGMEAIQYFHNIDCIDAINEFTGDSVAVCVAKLGDLLCLEVYINNRLVTTLKPTDYLVKENGLLFAMTELEYKSKYEKPVELKNEFLEEKINSLNGLLETQYQSCHGDLYNIGLYNGLAIACSILSGEKPVFYDEKVEVEKCSDQKNQTNNQT